MIVGIARFETSRRLDAFCPQARKAALRLDHIVTIITDSPLSVGYKRNIEVNDFLSDRLPQAEMARMSATVDDANPASCRVPLMPIISLFEVNHR